MTAPNDQRARIAAWVIGGLLLLAGATMRIVSADSEAMWRDEAQTIGIARGAFPAEILERLRHDGNSPLFYLAEHFVVSERGAAHRELRDRSLSVVFGVLLIALAFVAARLASGGSVFAGLTAAALVAWSPVLVDLSSQARPYAAVAMVTALMAIGMLRRNAVLYVIAAIAGFYLHALFATMLAAFAIAMLPEAIKTRRIKAWILTQIAIVVGILPGLWFLRTQVQELTTGGRIPWGSTPTVRDFFRQTAVLLTGAEGGRGQYVLLVIAIVLLALALRASGPARRLAIIALLALCASFVLGIRSGGFLTRYHVGSLTLALIAVSTGASALTMRAVRGAVIVALAMWGFVCVFTMTPPARSSSREVAEALNAAGPNDVIVMMPDTMAVGVNYYFPAGRTQMDLPSLQRTDFVDFRQWTERLSAPATLAGFERSVRGASAAKRRLWLVAWKRLFGPLPQMTPEDAAKSVLPAQWELHRRVMQTIGAHYTLVRAQDAPPSLEPMVVLEFEVR